jgi:hypothetical protein
MQHPRRTIEVSVDPSKRSLLWATWEPDPVDGSALPEDTDGGDDPGDEAFGGSWHAPAAALARSVSAPRAPARRS